jgi:hypothetical protein
MPDDPTDWDDTPAQEQEDDGGADANGGDTGDDS